MTITVELGRKATQQTKQNKYDDSKQTVRNEVHVVVVVVVVVFR